ncbi:unnamed protein product [Closterium sp. Naga37s-1]|nr:unnamed protein product [Closterium sp. Naga37s-1]
MSRSVKLSKEQIDRLIHMLSDEHKKVLFNVACRKLLLAFQIARGHFQPQGVGHSRRMPCTHKLTHSLALKHVLSLLTWGTAALRLLNPRRSCSRSSNGCSSSYPRSPAGAATAGSPSAQPSSPLLLPDGNGGGVAATAASATAAAALPLLDLLQLFLWVAVSPAVAEELLFRGLLLTALQERLRRPARAGSPEAPVANLQMQPTADDRPTVGTGFEAREVGKVEAGADREGEESIRNLKEKQGGTKEVRGTRRGRRAGKEKARSVGSESKSREAGASKEEEEAVAMIAQVLMNKYGPQIVKEEEEEEGPGNGRIEGREEVKGEEEPEPTTAAAATAAAAAEEEDGMDTEEEEEEAEAEASEEGSPGTTSRTPRATSRSPLLSFYRFFSSHLGISSPSTLASVLASYPQLLRSHPTNDFLPRVRLLQSYGISNADIVHITLRSPAWPRTPLPQIQNTLEFLLAKNVRRSRLGSVLRRGLGLLCREPRSTNLDILVERAGIPEDKLGVIRGMSAHLG